MGDQFKLVCTDQSCTETLKLTGTCKRGFTLRESDFTARLLQALKQTVRKSNAYQSVESVRLLL
jgi:hypothetical protein